MRLFAAIDLPEEMRRALGAQRDACRADLPPASWVKERNLHLTLVFFGEVDDVACRRLAPALRLAARDFRAPFLTVEGAGAFPPRGPIRVVWVGVAPAGPLARLSDSLRAAARTAGVAFDEKPFAAHVTLARCRGGGWNAALRARLVELAPAPPLEFQPVRAVLEASEFGAGGPTYREVASLPFAEAA